MLAPTRSVANGDRPAHVPVKPMGNVPVIVHVVWSDGAEEWRPARAVRWTATHVMVCWEEGAGGRPGPGIPTVSAARRDERWEWLRAQDVMRSVSWLVPPGRA